MRKLLLIICAAVLLCGCNSDEPEHNKVTTCEYESTSEDVTTKTSLKAFFMDSDLVSGNLPVFRS